MGRVFNKKHGYSETVVIVDEVGNTLGDTDSPITIQGSATATPLLVQNVGTSITNKTVLDIYGRQRVAAPATVFEGDFQSIPMIEDTLWDTGFTGLGATVVHNPLESSVTLTTLGLGDKAWVTTHQHFKQSHSVSHIAYLVCNLTANGVSRVGIFDNNDGVFFQMNDQGFVDVVVRSSITGVPLETVIPRAVWSDKLDGTGLSGQIIDFNLIQTFVIDYNPAIVGTIRMGVLIDSEYHACITLNGNNKTITPFFKSTTLPLTFESESAGLPDSMKCIAASLVMEGERNKRASGVKQYSARNIVGVQAAVGIQTPLLSIRVANILPLVPVTVNKVSIKVEDISILDVNASVFYTLYRNKPLVGAMWLPVGGGSGAEFDTMATSIGLIGGELVSSGFCDGRTTLLGVLLDAVQVLSMNRTTGIGDALTLCIEDNPLDGGATPHASITWSEEK